MGILLVITVLQTIVITKIYFDFNKKFKQLEEDLIKMRNENYALLSNICGKLWKEDSSNG